MLRVPRQVRNYIECG
jgi:hypothetical protein